MDEEIDVILINMPLKTTGMHKRPLSPAAHKDTGAAKKTHKEEEESASGRDN